MGTLINILLGFLLFMFTAVTILLLGGWIILQFTGTKTKEEECGCKTCDCDEPFIIEGYHNGMEIEDDTIPMLDRPLTKKEVKEMNMEEQNKEYNIMTARDMMTMKTEITQTASPENLNKSHRGKSYGSPNEYGDDDFATPTKDSKHNRDYINFLDELERKKKLDVTYEELRNREPLEENDPRPYRK